MRQRRQGARALSEERAAPTESCMAMLVVDQFELAHIEQGHRADKSIYG